MDGASLGNRLLLGRRNSFQTAGMHGEDLLALFGVGQQDEWYVVMSVAVPAQQVVARRQQRAPEELWGEVDEVDTEAGCEEEGGQDGGEERQPGVRSGAVAEGLLVGI